MPRSRNVKGICANDRVEKKPTMKYSNPDVDLRKGVQKRGAMIRKQWPKLELSQITELALT